MKKFKCKIYPKMRHAHPNCKKHEFVTSTLNDEFEGTKYSNCDCGGGSERYANYDDYIRIQYQRNLQKPRNCENCINSN